MTRHFLTFVAVCGLAGCGALPFGGPSGAPSVPVLTPGADTLRPLARPGARATGLGQRGQTADTLDTTSPAERAAAQAVDVTGGALLGETLASLGSPTEQGFWLRTGLVTRVTQGRVERVDGSGAIRVELRPSGAAPGAGSQLSLAAFRALGAPLTELLPLRVLSE
ncbi:D-galactarate dehydratase [Roseibaca sp. Y0-43]|uniref:D-galactarate dehydratase n=1 Tax=Roseibaca sp. Y0-43 TaxID=2816854 RepID=UPI001D0C8F9B|nr:D-galactarate dehydratase [Roseibaca sp. Y0-43]MCC1482153.1 D-galactarate dehydratase [Roseibaca sp. Y0-43]